MLLASGFLLKNSLTSVMFAPKSAASHYPRSRWRQWCIQLCFLGSSSEGAKWLQVF
jgi:hypothetical protein